MAPKITIDAKTIQDAKSNKGIYRTKKLVEATEKLRPMVVEIVKEAFINYAKKHGLSNEVQINIEWTRFNNELQKVL